MVLAQAGGGNLTGSGGGNNSGFQFSITNPFRQGVGNNLFSFIKSLIDSIVMPIGGVLCVLAFIYAGFLYVTAQGSESQIKQANNAFYNAALGTAVLLGSWVIAQAVCGTIRQLGGPACPI